MSLLKLATLLNNTTPCGAYIFIGTVAIPSFSYWIALAFVTFKVAFFVVLAAVFLNVISVFITTLIPLLISVTNSVCSPCIYILITLFPLLSVITSYEDIWIFSLYNKLIVFISNVSISLGKVIKTVGLLYKSHV